MISSSTPWHRGYTFLLISAGLAAAMADWLFYRHPIGWTAAWFAALLLALLWFRGGRFLRIPPGIVVFSGVLGLLVALVEQPTILPITMTALGLAALAVMNRSGWQGGTVAWAARLIELSTAGLLRALTDNRIAARWMRRHPAASAGPLRHVLLWILPVALSTLFVGLFAMANPIVGRWVEQLRNLINVWAGDIPNLLDGLRIFFWISVAAIVYALLRARVSRRRQSRSTVTPPLPPSLPETSHVRAGKAIVVRCLLAFNAVFAVQNVLDLAYLFGGAALPEGMTYAEYAHRGSYPLVATALLAALFVLITFRPGGAAERSTAARWLVFAWLAQNVLLTFSAAWRLDLYVDVYSLTRLRLAAGIWMLLVAAGLLWILFRILFRRTNAWLLDCNALTACVVLYACCFFNVPGYIADYNVRHCQETGGAGESIDYHYLYHLGPEALPALRRVEPLLADAEERAEARRYIARLEQKLDRALSDWRGWTLRRSRLAR